MRLCHTSLLRVVASCPIFVLDLHRVLVASKNGNSFRSSISPSCVFLILVATLLLAMSPARSKESVEVGGNCDSKRGSLASPLLCVEGYVVDCRTPANSQEQLYCAANELRKADSELNQLYQRVLKKFEMPGDEYADFKSARRALSEGQRAWVKFKKSDCEIPGYLHTRGSIQSAEIVECELKHTKNRIFDLKAYSTP
jgi:uncharacterized protein YecT (DUF1311 family)